MDIEKLIEQLNEYTQSYTVHDDSDLIDTLRNSATSLSTLQAENEKLRAELEQAKAERDAAINEVERVIERYIPLGPFDRLCELAQADREGRCVMLPAPLGNTVYRIEYVKQYQGRYGIGICKHQFDILFYAMECRNFGKTVFLTRADAEAALRREQDG